MNTFLNAGMVMKDGAHLQGTCPKLFSLNLQGENIMPLLQTWLMAWPTQSSSFCHWNESLSFGGGVLAEIPGHPSPPLLGCLSQVVGPKWPKALAPTSGL